MPLELALALSGHSDCEIIISTNEHALDSAQWSFTPFLNHPFLQTLAVMSTSIVKLDLIVLADDHGILSELGRIIKLTTSLRSLKVCAIGKTPPSARPGSRMSDKTLVEDLAWLYPPLQDCEKRLRLTELELHNFCVCDSKCLPLEEIIDMSYLRWLKLSCLQLLLSCETPLPGLRELRLAFSNDPLEDASRCITSWPAETVTSLLLRLSGLKSLEVVDRVDILTKPVLKALGPRLTTLIALPPKIHHTAMSRLYAPNPAVGLFDEYPEHFLESLGTLCPELANLSVSVPSATVKVGGMVGGV